MVEKTDQTAKNPATIHPHQALVPAQRAPVAVGPRGVQIRDLDSLYRMAEALAQSPDMRPKDLNTAAKCLVAMQMGMEAGFDPMASVRAIYIVNGMPQWYVNPAMALVLSSGKLKRGTKIETWLEVDGKKVDVVPERDMERMVAYCKTQRVDQKQPEVTAFSVEMAKRAKLWGKSGVRGPSPWVTRPDRMMKATVRRENLRDNFPDVLMSIDVGYRKDMADSEDYGEAAVDVTPLPAEAPPEGKDELLDLEGAVDGDVPVAQAPEPTDAEFEESLKKEIADLPEVDPDGDESPVAPEAEAQPKAEETPEEPAEYDAAGEGACPDCERSNDIVRSNGHADSCQHYSAF